MFAADIFREKESVIINRSKLLVVLCKFLQLLTKLLLWYEKEVNEISFYSKVFFGIVWVSILVKASPSKLLHSLQPDLIH